MSIQHINVQSLLQSVQQKNVDEETKKAFIHISIEKSLNSFYNFPFINLNIVLISKASLGFGDVIWGVRAIRVLINFFPRVNVTVISDGINKFQSLFTPSEQDPIRYIPHDDHELIPSILSESDLVIDGPYPQGRKFLGWNKYPYEQLYQGKIIDFIEYDRGDYFSSWRTKQMPSQFLSGLGDNAYGIFIPQEISYQPLSTREKLSHLDQLQDSSFLEMFQDFFPDLNNKLYLGYAPAESISYQKAFLETIIKYEDRLQYSDQDVIITLIGTDYLDEEVIQNLQSLFQEHASLNNISSIHLINFTFRIDEKTISSILQDRRLTPQIKNQSIKQIEETNFRIPEGKDYIIDKKEILQCSFTGKNIYIIPYRQLKKHDMNIMHQISENISLGTGDQTLSELISMDKFILYDNRKTQTLDCMIQIAEESGLTLISEFLKAFTYERNSEQAVNFLLNPLLEQEKNQLYKILKQRDLSKFIQQIVSRRIFHQKTNNALIPMEKRIHETCETLRKNPRESEFLTNFNEAMALFIGKKSNLGKTI